MSKDKPQDEAEQTDWKDLFYKTNSLYDKEKARNADLVSALKKIQSNSIDAYNHKINVNRILKDCRSIAEQALKQNQGDE